MAYSNLTDMHSLCLQECQYSQGQAIAVEVPSFSYDWGENTAIEYRGVIDDRLGNWRYTVIGRHNLLVPIYRHPDGVSPDYYNKSACGHSQVL